MTALMISMIKVKQPEKLQEYLPRVRQLGTAHGAELVFSGPAEGAITGKQDHEMVVVARFPSIEDIDALFASEEYRPLVTLREEAADMTIVKYRENG